MALPRCDAIQALIVTEQMAGPVLALGTWRKHKLNCGQGKTLTAVSGTLLTERSVSRVGTAAKGSFHGPSMSGRFTDFPCNVPCRTTGQLSTKECPWSRSDQALADTYVVRADPAPKWQCKMPGRQPARHKEENHETCKIDPGSCVRTKVHGGYDCSYCRHPLIKLLPDQFPYRCSNHNPSCTLVYCTLISSLLLSCVSRSLSQKLSRPSYSSPYFADSCPVAKQRSRVHLSLAFSRTEPGQRHRNTQTHTWGWRWKIQGFIGSALCRWRSWTS